MTHDPLGGADVKLRDFHIRSLHNGKVYDFADADPGSPYTDAYLMTLQQGTTNNGDCLGTVSMFKCTTNTPTEELIWLHHQLDVTRRQLRFAEWMSFLMLLIGTIAGSAITYVILKDQI